MSTHPLLLLFILCKVSCGHLSEPQTWHDAVANFFQTACKLWLMMLVSIFHALKYSFQTFEILNYRVQNTFAAWHKNKYIMRISIFHMCEILKPHCGIIKPHCEILKPHCWYIMIIGSPQLLLLFSVRMFRVTSVYTVQAYLETNQTLWMQFLADYRINFVLLPWVIFAQFLRNLLF